MLPQLIGNIMRLSNFSLDYNTIMRTPLLPLIIIINHVNVSDGENKGHMSLGDISSEALMYGPVEEWDINDN